MAASFSLRPQDSLWVGAHDARLTGDVVDETPGCKVDRADWSGVPDDLGDGVCPHHKLSLPYRALSSCPFAQVFEDDATRIGPAKLAAVGSDAGIWPRGEACRGRQMGHFSASESQASVRTSEKSGALRVRLELAGWLCAGRAVVGPWCEKYLVLGLEQGLLMGFRKDHRPEALCSDHREGEDKEAIIFLLTGAPNLLPTSLTLNGSYSHHLSSHTLSPIGNSGLLGLLRDRL